MNTLPDQLTQKKTARRMPAVRLFLYFCAFFTGFFLLAGGAEYVLSGFPASRALQKLETPAPSSASPSPEEPPLDLNAASYEDLLLLPGVGPSMASAILRYRETIGMFHYPEELMDVKGIGEKTFRRLSPLVACGHASPEKDETPAPES